MARTLNDVERENPNVSSSLISKLIEYRADDNNLRRIRFQEQTDNRKTISIPSGEPSSSRQNTSTSATQTSVTDPNKVNGTIPPTSTDTNANTLNAKFLKPGEQPSGSYKITMNDWSIGAKEAEKDGYVFGKEYTFIKCSGDNPNTVSDQRKRARLLVDQIKYNPSIYDDGTDILTEDRKTIYGKYIRGQFNTSNKKNEYQYIGDDVCPVGEEKKQPAPESSKPTAVVIKQDVQKKEEVKEKQAESPQTAPAVVDTSNALTEEKAKEIQQSAFQSTIDGSGWFVYDYMESIPNTKKMIDDEKLKDGKKFWIVRRKPKGGSTPTGNAQENEKKLEVGPALGSVQYYVGVEQKQLVAKAPVDGGIQSIVDVPLALNFPSVGVYNKAIPYMASGGGGRWPTEQLAIIQKPSIPWYNMGDWGIGNGGNPSDGVARSSWNENQWWCGAGSKYYTTQGKYSMPHGDPTGVPSITAGMMKKCATQARKMHPGRIYVDNGWDWGFLQVPVKWVQWANGNKGGNIVNGAYSTEWDENSNAYNRSWLMNNRTHPTPIVGPWVEKGAWPSAIKAGGSAAVFIAGVHYSGGSLTAAGSALWQAVTQRTNWEIAFVYNLSHVETVIWADPTSKTGRAFVMAGNCGPTFDDAEGGGLEFAADGGCFAVKEISIFGYFGSEHSAVILSKLSGGGNKVSAGLGAKFKSTPMVKDFVAKVKAGSDKNIIGAKKPAALQTATYYQVLQQICQI